MFSVVVETCIADNWFSNSLIDCFLTGTVPIYAGASNIGDYFNADGIIQFKAEEEFEKIALSKSRYEEMEAAIRENYETAKKYVSTYDRIADLLIQKFQLESS